MVSLWVEGYEGVTKKGMRSTVLPPPNFGTIQAKVRGKLWPRIKTKVHDPVELLSLTKAPRLNKENKLALLHFTRDGHGKNFRPPLR